MDGNQPSPGLWRIAAAARLAGMDADAFERNSVKGHIPVEVLRIGNRRFVRVRELAAWLREPNLSLE